MPRGRPTHSTIRQNIVELLFYLKLAYGYGVAHYYNEIFPEVSMRSIYYHLKKGVSTGEFEIELIREEKGDFSWGQTAEKIYYRLGPEAVIKGDKFVTAWYKRNKDMLKAKEQQVVSVSKSS